MGIAALLLFAGVIGFAMMGRRHHVVRPQLDRSEAVRRVLRHLARRSVAELTEGCGAVVRGTAVAVDAPLIAPVTGRRCIGYHVLVRDWATGSIIFDEARCGAFQIRDDTGSVRVDSQGLELAVVRAPAAYGPPLPRVIGERLPRELRYSQTWWSEGVLLDGMTVAACGVVRVVLGAGEMYREARRSVEVIASPTFPLVASPDADLAVPSERPYQPEELRD